MNFQRRFVVGNRFTHLQHVGTEHELALGIEIVGVILHEGGSSRQIRRHHFHGADQCGSFPIALAAETVAVGHQALHREARQLLETVQILKGRGETDAAVRLQKGAHAQFLAGAITKRSVLFPTLAQGRGNLVTLLILGA